MHGTIYSAGIFAVGSRCGKVILYDVNSFEQQEVIQIKSKFYQTKKNSNITDNCNNNTTISNINYNNSSTDDSNDQLTNADDKYHCSSIQSITSLLFGKMLLIKHSNCYDFSIIHLRCKNSHAINTSKLSSIFMPSLISSLTSPLYYKYINNNTYSSRSSSSSSGTYNEYQDTSVIASCVGNDQIFCIIRKHSNVLEFYFIDSHDNNIPKNYLNVSIKTISYHQHQQQKDYYYQSHHSYQQSHHQYNDHLHQKSSSSSSSYFPAVTLKNYNDNSINNDNDNEDNFDDNIANITIISCHVIISDRTYVISILGKLNKNHKNYNDHHNHYIYNKTYDQSLYLFSGSITLPHLPHITAMTIIKYLSASHSNKHVNYNNSTLNNNCNDNINAYFNDKSSDGINNNEHQDDIDFHPYVATLKQRILIDDYVNNNETSSSSSLSSTISNNYSFYGHYCAITTNDDIYVIDLLKVYISPINVLINTVCLSIIPSSLSMIGINSNWFDSTILLTSDDNDDNDDNNHDEDDNDCDEKHNIDRNISYRNHVNDDIYDNKKRIQAIIFNKKNNKNNCNLTTKDFHQHHINEEEDHLYNNKSTKYSSNSLSSTKSLYTKSLKLIVHRKYRGALLKFRIKCSK